MSADPESELKDILKNYDLGELVDLEKNERGFVNTAFAIETLANGVRGRYFLRKYKRGIREAEIQFEHSLIEHLLTSRSCPVARLSKTRDGRTYYRQPAGEDSPEDIFYAIFDFLPGEDRYTWVGPLLTRPELENAGIVLAQFHTACSSLRPLGMRAEPKIMEMLPVIAETAADCPGKSKHTVFDEYLMSNLERIQKNIEDTRAILNEPEARQMPEIVIHCDYHPGNLKFQGDQISGLFDFDWSKIDLRSFDVALALWYFCTSWEGPTDGDLRLHQVEPFLGAYQKYMQDHPGVGPLSPVELRYLPVLINASNLYILNWTVVDFYQKEVDPVEYLVFLRHHVKFLNWFEQAANQGKLEESISSSTRIASERVAK